MVRPGGILIGWSQNTQRHLLGHDMQEERDEPVDVQIGPQLYERAPQELRSRLWIALLDNGTLATSVENSAVCIALVTMYHLLCVAVLASHHIPHLPPHTLVATNNSCSMVTPCTAADAHRQRNVWQPARIRRAPQLVMARRGPPRCTAGGR